jgi:hypothetical protein
VSQKSTNRSAKLGDGRWFIMGFVNARPKSGHTPTSLMKHQPKLGRMPWRTTDNYRGIRLRPPKKFTLLSSTTETKPPFSPKFWRVLNHGF